MKLVQHRPWESRASFRLRLMMDSQIGARELIGLLDEIQFVDKLFWEVRPGTVLVERDMYHALSERFGFPGRHIIKVIDESSSPVSQVSSDQPLYHLRAPGGTHMSRESLRQFSEATRPPMDVFAELYPRWCVKSPASVPLKCEDLRVCAIVCPARSGSSLLSRLLVRSGVFRAVRENLRAHVVALAQRQVIDIVEWWKSVAANGAGERNMFGTKIVDTYLGPLLSLIDQEERKRLARLFSNWEVVQIVRENKVERAVSVYLAESIGVWQISSESSRRDYEESASYVSYDFERISKIYRTLEQDERTCTEFLNEIGEPRVVLRYEEIRDSSNASALRVLEALGVKDAAAERKLARSSAPLLPATTPRNSEFAQRFVQDLSRHGITAQPQAS